MRLNLSKNLISLFFAAHLLNLTYQLRPPSRLTQLAADQNKTVNPHQATKTPEELVYDYLFGGETYNAKIPPISANGSLSINIDIELEIMGVMEVDKDASTVTFKAAFRQWWYDPRLEWNPADFPSNVTNILVSSEDK